MKYDLSKKDNGIYVVEVDLDAKEWQQSLNVAYEKNKGKYSIPGFRKGHAPRNVIEKTYGEGAFFNEALDDVYYKAYTMVLREHEEIKPIDSPKLDIRKFDENGLKFALTIPCVPDFTLANYKGGTFTKQKVEVGEKEVEEEINKELFRASRLVDVKRAAKLEDVVTLDFDGYVDGKQFEGGQSENYQLRLGSHSFIDNFEEQLVGLKAGEKKDVVVTFPKDYHQKTLAGKKATFKCEIKAVRERIMPKLDEDFVKDSTEYDTVEAYKENIKARLTRQAEENAEIELENDMIDAMVDGTEFVVPDVLVDQEVERQINGMEAQMKYQGLTLQDYCGYIGKTVEQLKEEIRVNSTRHVKARLVLQKFIEVEHLEVNQKEIDTKLEEYAKKANQSLAEYKKQVNNNMVDRIANEMLMKKITDCLTGYNKVVEGTKKAEKPATKKAETTKKPATKTTTKSATKPAPKTSKKSSK